jgi:hypothetical protein
MTAMLAALAFGVALYALAAWLLLRERPRRRRWTRGGRS